MLDTTCHLLYIHLYAKSLVQLGHFFALIGIQEQQNGHSFVVASASITSCLHTLSFKVLIALIIAKIAQATMIRLLILRAIAGKAVKMKKAKNTAKKGYFSRLLQPSVVTEVLKDLIIL